MTSRDTSAVGEALAAVAETQARLNEVQALLSAQTRDLHDQLLLLGMDLDSSGETADPELIRRLYWDAPSLSTHSVYEAFGLRSPNDVSTLAWAPRVCLGLPGLRHPAHSQGEEPNAARQVALHQSL